MIGRSINLKLSGNNKPKEPKQKRKTRIRSSMPEGGEITIDVVFLLVCVLFRIKKGNNKITELRTI
jgi:hypothetical protein